MATGIRCLHHIQRFLQSIIFESRRQSVSLSNFPTLFKSCRSLCTKVSADGEMKTIGLDKETENYFDGSTKNTVSDESDMFGTLKISLEKQKRMAKNKDVLHNLKIPKNRRKEMYQPQNKLSESDTFGMLNDDSQWFTEVAEPEPADNSTIFLPETKYKSAQAYLKEMKRLVQEKKYAKESMQTVVNYLLQFIVPAFITFCRVLPYLHFSPALKEALELFPDMVRNNIFPINANYTFMIGACGRVGYTEMSFKLLKQMTSRHLKPTAATLTGLYNSCAECPFPEYGLQQIAYLKEKIAEKNWPLTQPTYHAMIKAYGKCGDIFASFQVVDEMLADGITVDSTTYQFLLMSCISDKEAGFTHAIEVWRKLVAKKHVPTIFCFNLMLRAARDCGIGPEQTSSLLLQHWSSFTKRPYGLNRTQIAAQNDMLKLANPELSRIGDGNSSSAKLIRDGHTTSQDGRMPSNEELSAAEELSHKDNTQTQERISEAPTEERMPKLIANLLVPRPTAFDIVDLLRIETASDRVALLGCAEGYLGTMSKYRVKPDIKTFMLLLETLPPSTELENDLVSLMDKNEVSPDTDFFNILIKRRNLRKDFSSARRVLLMIRQYHLSPDIVTFGVLSLGCQKRKIGQQLLRDMKQLGCHPNVEIMGALIHNAIQNNDFEYLMDLLQTMKYLKIRPNDRILSKLETSVEAARKIIIDKEQGKDVPHFFSSETYRNQFYAFCDFYTEWLKTTKMQVEEHPWDQYKTEIQVKDRELRFLV